MIHSKILILFLICFLILQLIPVQVNLLCPSINSPSPRFGFSSSASTETNERKNNGESDLSRDDLIKRVAEKEELLKLKHKEIEQMKDKVLRTYAGMANVMDRTRRDAENSKKFAIQVYVWTFLSHNLLFIFLLSGWNVRRILQRVYWMLRIIWEELHQL